MQTRRTRALAVLASLASAAAMAVVAGPAGTASAAASHRNTVRPSVKGTVAVGRTVTCDPGRWSGGSAAFRFAWKRSGHPVAGATKRTYRVTRADAGARLSCAARPAGGAQFAASDTVAVVSAPVNQVAPSVTSSGGVLTCDPGAWSESPDVLLFEWTRDGSPVEGAFTDTLAPGANGTYRCLVAGRNAAGQSGYITSADVAVGGSSNPSDPSNPSTNPTQSAPQQTAKAVVTADRHGVLHCAPGTWTPTPDVLLYSWTRDGSPVPGATSDSLWPDDIGHTYVCLVAGRNSAGQSGYLASDGFAYDGRAHYATDSAWSAAGNGASVVSDGTAADPQMHYDTRAYGASWWFGTTVINGGSRTLAWTWTGLHSWYAVHESMTLVIRDAGGSVVSSTPLVNAGISGDFSFHGSTTIAVPTGGSYRFELSGSNFDASQILVGTLTVSVS